MQLGEKAIARSIDSLDLMTGDPRRTARAKRVVELLARSPQATLPAAAGSLADLEGIYRFLRNPNAGFPELMESAQSVVHQRAQTAKSVVVIHDTTEFSFSSASGDEIGWLDRSRPGFLAHHSLIVDEQTHRPLGVLWSEVWGRPFRKQRGRAKRLSGTELSRKKERESDRWITGVAECAAWLEDVPHVHVMDREVDNYRLLRSMVDSGEQVVVRVSRQRKARRNGTAEWTTPKGLLMQNEVRFERTVKLSRRIEKSAPRQTHKGRKPRLAKLVVRAAASVVLKAPRYIEEDKELIVNLVHVLETNPPEGAEPVEWFLVTTLPVKTNAQIERVVDLYRMRWLIEDFHKAIKSGCGFKDRRVESFEGLTSLLAMSYLVANELLWMRARAREEPSAPATTIVTQRQLKCLQLHKKTKVSERPDAREILRVIAQLGGYQPRKQPPGWLTLSRGFTELVSFEAGFVAALEMLGEN